MTDNPALEPLQTDPGEVGARIESILGEFRSAAPAWVVERTEDLVGLLVELYGAGLARMAEMLDEETLRGLVTDDLVASLLVLHDLHPDSTEVRVAAALDQVRPFLGSHAGGVQLIGIDDGVVRLRLEGSCDGCPSSLVTVKMAIEAAIEKAAPEVTVEVEGVTDSPTSRTGPQFVDLAPPPPANAFHSMECPVVAQ